MKLKGRKKLELGDFNNMSQKTQPDGSTLITIYKRGENETHQITVKNLYKKNEELLSEKVLMKNDS